MARSPNWQAEICVGEQSALAERLGYVDAGDFRWLPRPLARAHIPKIGPTAMASGSRRRRRRRHRHRQRRLHIICANYRQRVAIFSIGNDAAGSLDSLSIYGLAG